jgi:cytochrome c55X
MTLGGGLGKPLTPAALADLQVDSIAFIILEGVPGQPMPPWKGLLTAQEAHWIASKLKEGFPE